MAKVRFPPHHRMSYAAVRAGLFLLTGRKSIILSAGMSAQMLEKGDLECFNLDPPNAITLRCSSDGTTEVFFHGDSEEKYGAFLRSWENARV